MYFTKITTSLEFIGSKFWYYKARTHPTPRNYDFNYLIVSSVSDKSSSTTTSSLFTIWAVTYTTQTKGSDDQRLTVYPFDGIKNTSDHFKNQDKSGATSVRAITTTNNIPIILKCTITPQQSKTNTTTTT